MGHHYVPQRYLRNFECATRPGFIFQYDKRTGKSSQASISKVAQQRHFYDPATESMLDKKVETPGSSAIEKLLLCGALLSSERESLVLFIATMLMRVPTRRERALSLIPRVVANTQTQFSAKFHNMQQSGQISAEHRDQLLAAVGRVSETVLIAPPAEMIAHIRNPLPSSRILEAIDQMTLRVVDADSPITFITSDNPVFFFPELGIGPGLGEVTVPLSSSCALHGSHQGGPDLGRFVGRSQLVNEFNRRTVSAANRFVFHHEDAIWLSKLTQKAELRRQRIVWE